MTTENTEIPTDEELMSDVLSDDPEINPEPETTVVEKPEPEAGETVKAETVKDDAVDSRIPAWRREEIAAEKNRAVDEAKALREQLAAERSQRERAQQRLAELEKPSQKEEKAKPDPLLDPDGYTAFVKEEIRQELLAERREASLAQAHKTYKTEFEEAYAAAQKHVDPALKARMQQSRDPGETLIEWHRELKTRAEVGTDLTAYKAKLRDEYLKDPEFRKAAMEAWRDSASPTVNGRPRIDLAPTLSGASRANALLKSENNTDPSDRDLWNEVTAG
jgi:hypothetical protein